MIATEKKTSSILVDSSMIDKVSIICPNIGMVYSGMGPDFRVCFSLLGIFNELKMVGLSRYW